ncbi:CYTH domain-containing protein [Shewanella sp. AS16]|uniref:CYTH domain-containing protein n=1 Tax=Shewanella sp. AS16 TaxID=2907625 RepID=UPI001F341D04|nr:CYTH domain-containing protein [Shewanella sp. AS16]MCE9685586.1 CYTH domain-containing protein [Shewanella sp. AS16]
MDAEIELKLFFPPNYQETLIKILDAFPGAEAHAEVQLANGYFDTPELQLRRWDMGLRVRRRDAHREQTIKTAGKVVGGIHSRPEYNVTITQNVPDLSLFPAKIWPEGADVAATQAGLTCLFHTDFTRRAWHISVEGADSACGASLVEVALDLGKITAKGRQQAICELEFELLAGDTSALLTLAELVAKRVPVRLGKASKAQRGYQLAESRSVAKGSSLVPQPLDFIALSPELNQTQTLQTLVETGLERWQLLEAQLAAENDPCEAVVLWTRLRACIRFLRLSLAQFDLLDSMLASGFACIEAELAFIDQGKTLVGLLGQDANLFAKHPRAQILSDALLQALDELKLPQRLSGLWALPEYGQLQLALVQQLLRLEKSQVPSLAANLKDFADLCQQASWSRLQQAMPVQARLASQDYLQLANTLDECLLVGLAYGGLYPQALRDEFRAPWQDLAVGIHVLGCYLLLAELSSAAGLDMEAWLYDKHQSLLFAMEHSRRSALQNVPYWG